MHNDYWLGPSDWRVLVGQHVTAGSAAAWSRLRTHCGIVPPASRSQGARRLGTWQLSYQGLCLPWQLTHLPVSELPWPGAGGSG